MEVGEGVGVAAGGVLLLFGGEVAARSDGFDGVVEVGEAECGVFVLASFSVGVDGFADGADGGLLLVGGGGEWEGLEAAGGVVDRVVSDAEVAACRV